MQKSSSTQIIPLPLPAYLATFFASQITTTPYLLNSGSYAKPFYVRKDSRFGKLILQCLITTEEKPKVKEGFTFFIEVSDYQTNKPNNNIVDSRSSFMAFSDEDSENKIISIFKDVFESHLVEHVLGFRNGILHIYPQKKRGILKPAVLHFCKLYGVKFTNKNLEAWRKLLQREFLKDKPHKIKMLS